MLFDHRAIDTFTLSSYPARWIDNLILYSPKFGTTESAKMVGARGLSLAISLTALPLAIIADFALYSGKSLASRTWSVIAPDQSARTRAETTALESFEVAKKCLRAIPFWATSLRYRDVISNHFLPEKKPDGKIRGTGGLYEAEAQREAPRNVEEVIKLLQPEVRKGRKISIMGSGFSQGKQALPSDLPTLHIDMSNVNHVIVNKEKMTAIVGGGATWEKIQDAADAEELAIRVQQASNPFSFGGSFGGINCHGWDIREGTLAETVNWIKVVNPSGEVKTLFPNDEGFQLAAGGLGLFGVIVEAEVRLTENQELFDSAEQVSIEKYVDYFEKKIEHNDVIKMHLYRLSLEKGRLLQRGWAQNYSTHMPGTPTENLVDEPARGTFWDRILMQVARNSPLARTLWWRIEEKNLQKIKRGTRNEIMRPPINSVFINNSNAFSEWLQEYFVPRDKLAPFLKFLGGVLNDNHVALCNASVRFVKEDKISKLGYAKGGDRFAIVLFFTQSLNEKEVDKTKAWVQKVVDWLGENNGTFYLPYMHFATREQFRKCYPQWKEVLDKKREFDPEEVFYSGFYQDYFVDKGESL